MMPHHWRPLAHEQNSIYKCNNIHVHSMIPEDQKKMTTQWCSTGPIIKPRLLYSHAGYVFWGLSRLSVYFYIIQFLQKNVSLYHCDIFIEWRVAWLTIYALICPFYAVNDFLIFIRKFVCAAIQVVTTMWTILKLKRKCALYK